MGKGGGDTVPASASAWALVTRRQRERYSAEEEVLD